MADNDISYTEKKDYLTQCYTRDFYFLFLWRQAGVYESSKVPFSVMLTDLDRFKFYNDKYGHLCGDELLKYFASSVRLVFENEGCVPFRLGGDEFLIVFPGKTSAEAYRLAQRLRKSLKGRPCLFKGRRLQLTFSGGIASFPQDGKTVEVLLENADKAMYHSKKHGRNSITEYEKIQVIQGITRVVALLLIPIAFLTFFLVRDNWNKEVFDYFKLSNLGAGISAIAGKAHSGVASISEAVSQPEDESPVTVRPAAVTPPPASSPDDSASTPVPAANIERDAVYMLSGAVMKGVVIKETDQEVVLEFPLSSGGTGVANFAKSKIAKIERGEEV